MLYLVDFYALTSNTILEMAFRFLEYSLKPSEALPVFLEKENHDQRTGFLLLKSGYGM